MEAVLKYIDQQPDWSKSLLYELRRIILQSGLTETLKWGAPVYMHRNNVIGLAAFKNHVALWFFQGVFLADEEKVLVSAGDKTKALRQWRFSKGEMIREEMLMAYIQEAIMNDEQGLRISPSKAKVLPVPEILESTLHQVPALQRTFDALSPSCRNEYIHYINEAKREETRQKRVDKVLQLLAEGKGLNDKYKK
jgi:uncharacterized protein YdeI (YjbR/CyaY-like superfamily)